MVVMSSFVSFIIVIGLTLLAVSPMGIVWCVIFIELFLLFSGGVYFWLQTTNRICHKYSWHYLYSAPQLVSHLRAGLFFNPSLEISSCATTENMTEYRCARMARLLFRSICRASYGPFSWIRHVLVSHYFSQIPLTPTFFVCVLWDLWDENSSKNY